MKALVKKKGYELFAMRVRSKVPQMHVSAPFSGLVQQFDDVFLEELLSGPPPEREADFEIKLRSNEPLPVRPVIRLYTVEPKEQLRQLQQLLYKGLIRPSFSPYGAFVFFIEKKEGDLRMVCDFRALKHITVPYSYPLPLISDAIDQVAGTAVFSEFELLGAYHQIRICEEDCHKTAIRTCFGSCE